MKIRIIYIALAIAVAVAAVCSVAYLCRTAQENPPVAVGIEDISEVVDGFCTALEEGDYSSFNDMVYGYSELGLAGEAETEGANMLLECLRSSYTCAPLGESRMDGMNAQQDISVSYFSVAAAEESIRQRSQELYSERIESAEVNEELYDEQGELLESVAMEIYSQSLSEIIGNAGDYMTERTITLNLTYSDGRWQIVMDDLLIGILFGDINRY